MAHDAGYLDIFAHALIWKNDTIESHDSGYKDHNSLDASELALPLSAQVVLITVYTATILLSVTGNLLVIVVLLSANRTRTDITVFLVNLAVADISMAAFCMPFTFTQTMLGHWIFGEIMCPLVRFMQVTSVAVSIFTNMAIGVDRLVSYPILRISSVCEKIVQQPLILLCKIK